MLHTFMAKKSMIQREKKRNRLVITYKEKRNALKQEIKNTELFEEKLTIHRRLQLLPRNSSTTRLHNRCLLTGRPKGYFRDFGLSRHLLREMAHNCLLPGVTKSSW
jgi:small subunit ribosomal protein S14